MESVNCVNQTFIKKKKNCFVTIAGYYITMSKNWMIEKLSDGPPESYLLTNHNIGRFRFTDISIKDNNIVLWNSNTNYTTLFKDNLPQYIIDELENYE